MAKIKFKKDTNIFGIPFFKDEVIEGQPLLETGSGKPMKGWFTIMRNGKKITVSPFDVVEVPDATPLNEVSKDKISDATNINSNNQKTLMIASSIGALAGLGFAYYRKSKIGGYVGYFILGSIVGSLIGSVITPKNKK